MSERTWDEGFAAHNNGDDIDDCPYSWGEKRAGWVEGWTDALECNAFADKERLGMTTLALVPDVAEPNVNWLALVDDEVADLYDALEGCDFDDIRERLHAMLFLKPLLLIVD